MAIKIKEKDKTKTPKTMGAWTGVLKHVPVKLIGKNGFALIVVDEGAVDALEAAPVDVVVQDGVTLINLSKYCRCAVDGTEVEDVTEIMRQGIANVKVRHADYDYTYKGKKGHTSKLEVIGIAFIKSQPIDNVLSELAFDDDDDVNIDDLPF